MKLLAIEDGFMNDGSQFCTKGKAYPVVKLVANEILIYDDNDALHYFNIGPEEYVDNELSGRTACYRNWFVVIDNDQINLYRRIMTKLVKLI